MSDSNPQDKSYWDKVERLFEEASLLSPEAQIPFLQKACEGNDVLFKEIKSLLDASHTEGPLDRFNLGLTSLLDEDSQSHATSERFIGPYRLIRVLGYGGMGTVYQAERSIEGFEQRVAIKLIRRQNAPEVLKQRFFRERQILATLEHKHIARFLDGGMTEPTPLEPSGQPYLAMEYVDGVTITEYCDTHHLSINDRLRLFAVVCDTVHYAHRHLVIHRDLKPTNIHVTPDGEVKLLDFGVAKLLHTEEHTAHIDLTQSEMRILTPGYAAPEQFQGYAPTTATDVYSLGVVLYELLTGHRPHPLQGLTSAEIERVVCEEIPGLPSSIFKSNDISFPSDSPRSLEDICQHRSSSAHRLYRQLQGDLDTIVMKSLAIEPDRRYGSAEAFLHDVERYLEGLPVLAQKATLLYRFQKFAARNRRAVFIAGLFALSLIAGLAGTSWQAKRATEQAQIAQEERDRARSEAAKAEQISGFLSSLFEQSDPYFTYGDTLTAFDILAEGSTRLLHDLADQPEVQASLLQVIAQSYLNLGDYESARDLFSQALLLREHILSPPHADIAQSMTSLAYSYSYLGDQVVAESLYVVALSMQQSLYEDDHPVLATTLDEYADVLFEKGEYAAAETLYVEALEIRRRLYGPTHSDVATSLNSVATIQYYMGRVDEAKPLFEEALAVRRLVLDERHPDIASSLNNLAILYAGSGNYAEAEPLHRESLELRKEVFGADHPRISVNMNNLASVLTNLGKHEEAEELFQEALDHVRRNLGDEHPRNGLLLHNLGRLHLEAGDHTKSIASLSDAINLRKRILTPDHPNTALSMGLLATAYQRELQYKRAEAVFREALGMLQRSLTDQHVNTMYMKSRLASVLIYTHSYEEAEVLLTEALPLLEEEVGQTDDRTRDTAGWLIELYSKTNRTPEAELYRSYLASSGADS